MKNQDTNNSLRPFDQGSYKKQTLVNKYQKIGFHTKREVVYFLIDLTTQNDLPYTSPTTLPSSDKALHQF